MKADFVKIREFNRGLTKDGVPGGSLSKADLTSMVMDDSEQFSKDVAELRSPTRKDRNGKTMAPSLASFSDMLIERYGINIPKAELAKDKMAGMRRYLQMLGLSKDSTLLDVADFLKVELSPNALESYLTTDVAKGLTFIIREVIMEPIRLGFLNASMAQNWIARSQAITDQQVTMPQILKGDGTPKYLAEGETIPFGTVQFGQKQVSVRPVGTGFELTEELIYRSTIDNLAEYVATVGEDMGLAKDCLAIDVLKNGEQGDASENAPVIGVESTSNKIDWVDILRIIGQGRRLNNVPTVVITQAEDGLQIALTPEIQGFPGDTNLTRFASIFGKIPDLQNYSHGLVATGTAIFLCPEKCMTELQWRPMKTERRDNPQNRKKEFYTSAYVGYNILRKDARVIVDGSETFAAHPWPSYMDVDSYQNNPFTK